MGLTDFRNKCLKAISATITAISAVLTLISGKIDLLAKESTLTAIKSQTDKLVFDQNKLRTTGEDGGSSGGGTTSVINLDAGGRARTSEQTTLIDLKQIHDDLPNIMDTETGGSGVSVFDIDESHVTLSVANSGDFGIRQTKMRFNYQSGKSFENFHSIERFEPQAGVVKRFGYFNSSTVSPFDSVKDGYYFESSNGTVKFIVSKNGTENYNVDQANWDDPLDGTGASGVTVDWSSPNVVPSDFVWLGVDKIRLFISVNSELVNFHTINHGNNGVAGVYMKSPNHSIRYEIRSTGGAGDFIQICSSANIEGSKNRPSQNFSINKEGTPDTLTNQGVAYAVLAAKLKSTHYGADVEMVSGTALSVTNDAFLWELLVNPQVSNLSDGNFADYPNSAVRIARYIGNGNVVNNKGIVVSSGYVSKGSSAEREFENAIRMGVSIAGVEDVFVIAITPLTNNLQIFTSANWREIL